LEESLLQGADFVWDGGIYKTIVLQLQIFQVAQSTELGGENAGKLIVLQRQIF